MSFRTGVTREEVILVNPKIDDALQKCFVGQYARYADFIKCYCGKYYSSRVTWNNIFRVLEDNGYHFSIDISGDRLTA